MLRSSAGASHVSNALLSELQLLRLDLVCITKGGQMNSLTVTGAASVTVAPNADALAHRDSYIASARVITSVASPEDLQSLKLSVQALKTIVKDAEKNRVEVKSEPLRITQEIDRVAKEFAAPLQSEITRLEGLANAYTREQLRIQQEAQRKAQEIRAAEEHRIAAEAEAERNALREAREKEERERQAAQAAEVRPNAFGAARAAIAAQQAEDAIEVKAAQQIAQVQQRTEIASPAIAVKSDWKWSVVDALAFANAHPTLVTITPNTREVNALVASGAREIAGLKVWEEVRAKL